MKKYRDELPLYNLEQIKSISNIAQLLVKHILLENMLTPEYDENISEAVCYIHENLKTPLTIQDIAQSANISKSALYRNFHISFGCTVIEHVTKKHIEKAIELMREEKLTIEELALRIGFSSSSYFSKMFKKVTGVSPLKYYRVHFTWLLHKFSDFLKNLTITP
ncbi:MAG: helix-turn-helix transcriptional regulator [Clostridia bacterium]|nr:helix-turn-helix transcriptional regulator [Clostridia bacterium]